MSTALVMGVCRGIGLALAQPDRASKSPLNMAVHAAQRGAFLNQDGQPLPR